MHSGSPRRPRSKRTDLRSSLEVALSAEQLAALRSLAEWTDHVRAVPGIVAATGAAGPRARIAGTGIDVFEVIRDYVLLDRDAAKLAEAYDWLAPQQIEAALAYFEKFPDEILDRIALEEAFAREFSARRS
jgi:uncharacterized protein (DUF433 family)